MAYCVIQEIQRKKPNTYGHEKELEAYSPYEMGGKRKYSYRYTGGRFERPIQTAYKVTIHENKRVNGVVTKKQYPVTTFGYYDLTEFWIGDCIRPNKLESIGASLNTSVESLWDLINAKVDPLQERIKAEFEKTPEYKTRVKHEKIIRKYQSKKAAFAKGYGIDESEYDYCFDIFGNVMNQAYVDAIIEADRRKKQTYRSYYESGGGNYTSSGNDWSKLFGSASVGHSAEDKLILKKFYRSLSKVYHPDKNLDTDTHAEMVLLNRLKEEWGI